MSKQKTILAVLGGVFLVVIAAALVYWFYFLPQTGKDMSPAAGQPNRPATADQATNAPAAANEPNIGFVPAYREERVPLDQVANYQALKSKYGLNFSAAQEKYLEENRFLLIDHDQVPFLTALAGPNFDQWLKDSDALGGGSIFDRKPEDTVLVTPDLVLHAYHKYFELTLEKLEQHELSQALGDFLSGLHANLADAAAQNSGTIKERYQSLEAQILLARVLFENKNAAKPSYFSSPDEEQKYNDQDKDIDSLANAEKILNKYAKDLPADLTDKIRIDLAAIYSADAIGQSPLFKQYDDQIKTDYTQFTPRSHYAKNSVLRAYFRAMMYLGRSSYLLKSDLGIADTNLLVKQMARSRGEAPAPLEAWKKIMAVTGFYAGESDDLSYLEWQNFKRSILGEDISSDADLIAPANISKLAQNLDQLRLPQILSDVIVDENMAARTKADLLRQTLGFRIFGQKFTYDAWILNSLTAGEEKTDAKLPSTPSALFIPAAFGDGQAQSHTQQFLNQDTKFTAAEITGFLSKLEQKRADIAKVKNEDWFHSMGSAWLYILGSLTHDYGAHYPLYMQTRPFLDKQIQSFLGSYAELKHDTLLYAKQSYAELGAGGNDRPIPPVVKGFVEPNLEFWTRFNNLLSRTDQLFRDNDLFKGDAAADRLHQFQQISALYAGIAEKELRGQAISDDDYESLRTTKLSFMAQPFEAVDPDETSGQTALIADIHTDAVRSQILYEATAKPYLMLAIVGNEGSPRVAAGLVYNHYELTDPIGRRLTDEDWRKRVYQDNHLLPAKNFWYQSLLVK
ncbi:MAG: DUF3160 domain-containing protein [Patescibacteria group bacterium]